MCMYLFLFFLLNQNSVSAFAAPKSTNEKSPTENGWKTRPLIPELANSNPSDDPKSTIPWDGFRFLKQSSKFISFPKPFRSGTTSKNVNPGKSRFCL